MHRAGVTSPRLGAGNKISKPGLISSRATASVFLSFATVAITVLQK